MNKPKAMQAKMLTPLFGTKAMPTTNTMQQAIDRAGGRLGNKGEECAVAAIKMAKF